MTSRRSDARRADRRNKTRPDGPDRTPPVPAYTGFGGNTDFGADSPMAPRAPQAPVSDSHGFGQYAEIGQGAAAAPAAVDPSSQTIREDIRQRFATKPSLDCSGIEVSMVDGVVTLDGHIDSPIARQGAEELCEQVPGVRSVRNNLRPIHATKRGHSSRRS
jgi:hypothetical protein